MASSQWSTIGWFTGWRPTRGLLRPSALTRSAAFWMSSTALMTLRFSPWHPRNLQARRRDHLAHHLVDTAAERDDEIALGLAVEPLEKLGGFLVGRVAVSTDDRLGEPPDVLNALGAKHFGCRRVGDVDVLSGRRHLPVQQLVDAPHGLDLAERTLDVVMVERGVPGTARLGRPCVDAVIDGSDPPGGTEHHSLVVELGGDQPPAAVLLADEHVGRYAHVAVVGGVGVVRAVGQDHRRPGVAGVLRIDDQYRNALVLHGFRIGPARQPDEVGVMTTGGEDLLPVDDVLVAVTDRGGAQRRQIGACVGLRVADREVQLTGEDRGQELLLLQVAAELLQGRPDGLQGDGRQRHVGSLRLVDEDRLLDGAVPETAEFLGPADAELAVRAHPLDDRAIGLVVAIGLHRLGFFGTDQVRKVLPQFSWQLALLRGQFDVHYAPTKVEAPRSVSRCDGPPSRRVRSLIVE